MAKYDLRSEFISTNVEGIQVIPKEWCIKQVRYLLKDGADGIKIGPFGSALKLEDMVDDGFSVYGQENVIKKDFSLGKRKISEAKFQEMSIYRIFPKDILITMMGTSGKCEIVPSDISDGIIDSHLLRVRVKEDQILPEFFKLLIDKSPEISYQIQVFGKGSIMHGLNSGIVKSLNLPLPSIEEQKLILNFLDHETAKIDSLIEKQQQLIQLLKEKRQAVISHAVTKGLNSNVPMKDSGVEWLGKVPEHWKIPCTKYLLEIPITDGPHETPQFVDDGIPFISAEAIYKGKINFDKKRGYIKPELNHIYSKKYSPKVEDIYMVKSGATTGKVAMVETKDEFNIWSPLAVFRCNKIKILPKFLFAVFNSNHFYDALVLNWSYGTQQNIGMGVLSNIEIPCPPINEQEEIIQHIDNELKVFKILENKANHAIQLMQERRTALISSAVTGKIDVRYWQNPNKNNEAKMEFSA